MQSARIKWSVFLDLNIVSLCCGMCVSILAPFYPAEAEAKGASASEFGFIFGFFYFTSFVVSPFLGKYFDTVGAKFFLNIGILIIGLMCIFFGFLDYIESHAVFTGLSFAFIIVEGVGYTMYLTSIFTITACEFPENMSPVLASLHTFHGVGSILGPTIGELLYEANGFYLVFIIIGCCLVLVSGISYFILSGTHESFTVDDTSLLTLLSLPNILCDSVATTCVAFCIGFNYATLEPYLRLLGVTHLYVSLMFVIIGLSFAVFSMIMGIICKSKGRPRIVMASGAICIAMSYLFLSHASYINCSLTLSKAVVCFVMLGLGISAMIVSTMTALHQDAKDYDFPDDLTTNTLIASLWTSAYSLGMFLGPSIGGVLVQIAGYHTGAAVATGLMLVICIILFIRKIVMWATERSSKYLGEKQWLLLKELP